MKRLESLNVSKNNLKRIPQYICECSRLNELNLTDNTEIWHIPERVSYMPSLQMLSVDRKSSEETPHMNYKLIYILNVVIFSRLFINIFACGFGQIYRLFKNI